MFTGSYQKEDVVFLLKPIVMESTLLEDKEKNIQTQGAHYSEMITYEEAPTPQYSDIFYNALSLNESQFAKDLYLLAYKINSNFLGPITLVSLARAGTPIGVLLSRILKKYFNRFTTHYSVSIIRDKGLDCNALEHILKSHEDTSIAFIDGWTGKGVIGGELKKSIDLYNSLHATHVKSDLYVVADICATATHCATHSDYLLPSSVLNSTVSGLVSRTILNTQYVGPNDFHACMYYEHLLEHDISVWFINHMMQVVEKQNKDILCELVSLDGVRCQSLKTVQHFMSYYGLSNQNFVKPGCGEATRVLLRRGTKALWVKSLEDPQVSHLIYLAKLKNIKLHVDTNMFYNVVAVINEIKESA